MADLPQINAAQLIVDIQVLRLDQDPELVEAAERRLKAIDGLALAKALIELSRITGVRLKI